MSMKLPREAVPIRPMRQFSLEPLGSLPGPVDGVVFDTGDVLYDATVWRRWLLKLLGRLGLVTNYHCFFRVWEREFLGDVNRGRREFWEAFGAFLLSAGLTRGQIEEIEVAARGRRSQWMAGARPLPGVCSTLGRLSREGVPLVAICDSELSPEAIQQQLERVGVADLFRGVVCSRELGHVKPEAASYRAALEAAGLPAERTAFVGHDADELVAAAALGMQTVAFNFDVDAEADVYLSRFDELADLVLARRPLAAAG